MIRKAGPRNRVDVRIQEGCDNLCSYCVIPYVRGAHLQSKPMSVAVDEVVSLATTGVKEVVLTGTELGKYGEAPDQLSLLLDGVLTSLEDADLPTRVRLSSLNPDAVSGLLVSQFVRHPALCRQLHLPLQSGSDRILERMRRPYTSARFAESVDRLRSVDALFSLTTDVIVGFPGETEEDAACTLDMVRRVGFAKVHVFPYSRGRSLRRRGNPAAYLPGSRLHASMRCCEQLN